MLETIKQVFTAKREYKQQIKRAQALPEDYRFVFDKSQAYIWSFAGGRGYEMLKTLSALLDFFEQSAQEGKKVLEVTGEDVATFCDDFIRDTRKWTDYYRERLNRTISKL